MNQYAELAKAHGETVAQHQELLAALRPSPEEIAAQRAEEEAYRREEREDAARTTRQQQAALALQLAVQVESGTGVGNPGTILEIATDFLAFLTGEPKTQITN